MSSASQYKTAAFGDDQKHHIPGAEAALCTEGGWWGLIKEHTKGDFRQESTSTFCMFFYLLQVGFLTVTFPHSGLFLIPPRGALESANVRNWEWRPLILPSCWGSLLFEKNQKVIAWVWMNSTLSFPRSRPPHLTHSSPPLFLAGSSGKTLFPNSPPSPHLTQGGKTHLDRDSPSSQLPLSILG